MKLIVAVAANGVIGGANTIPWHNPTDLKRFSELTKGHCVLMGSKTWESLPARFRPLPNRRNFVVSASAVSDPLEAYGARWFPSVEAAIRGYTWERAVNAVYDHDLFIIGGGQIYKQLIEHDLLTELHISRMHFDAVGDVLFPAIPSHFRAHSVEASDKHDYEIWRRAHEAG